MEQRRVPEYTIEVSADRSSVKDVVKGVLHTIFFHRTFTPLHPATHDVLDITLPYVSTDEIAKLIDAKSTSLVRSLDNPSTSTQTSPQYNSPSKPARSTLVVQFSEKKRRKSGWFGVKGAEEESVWENWIVEVSVTSARSEPEAERNRRLMERQLQRAAEMVVEVCSRERGHIPPITTSEANPFPYQILVNPRGEGWGQKLGIF